MMFIKKNIFHVLKNHSSHLHILLNNPLSILRFFLALNMGSGTVNKLNTVYSVPYYSPTTISKTWIVSLFPDSLLAFEPEQFSVFLVLILFCAIGAAIGFLGRLSLLLLAISSFLLGGIVEGLGNFDHHYSFPSQVLFVLAVVPGSMGISLDNYLLRKLSIKKIHEATKVPKWGGQLVLTLLIATYFTAGVSKIRYGGIQWLEGTTLAFYFENHVQPLPKGQKQLLIVSEPMVASDKWKDPYGFQAHTYGNYQRSALHKTLTDWVVSKPYLVSFFAVLTVLIELMGFTVFINSKWRNLYLMTAILMHTSIGVLMGLYFTKYRLICFCLIDWKSLYQLVRKKMEVSISGVDLLGRNPEFLNWNRLPVRNIHNGLRERIRERLNERSSSKR